MNKILFSTACLLASLFMIGCDTDVEPMDINQPGIEHQNAEQYAKYLANLKNYKAGKHKVLFGWFDNISKNPTSQGENIHAVPDSLDYLVLKEPRYINARETKEIDDLHRNKGTKVLYEISFPAIKAQYDTEKKAFTEKKENAGKSFTAFNTYLVDSVGAKLSYCDKYNLDGVVITFEGKTTIYLTEQEKEELAAMENDFMGIAKDWKARHAGKSLVFAGKPQNITDQTIFKEVDYIIIPCIDVKTGSGVSYLVNKAAVEGVPTDKFVPWVSTTSLDASDLKTGYWANGVVAVLGAAKWVAGEYENYQPAGLAVDNINTDYYHANFTYPTLRKAISIINPTVQN